MVLSEKKKTFFSYLKKVATSEKKLLLKGDLVEILRQTENKNNGSNIDQIEEVVNDFTEAICTDHTICLEVRETIGKTDYFSFNTSAESFKRISAVEYLKAKEHYRYPLLTNDMLTLNFETFYEKFPRVRESRSIGKGVEYLNRYLSSTMFTNPQKLSKALFDFLFVHRHNSEQLIVNDKIDSPEKLTNSIENAIRFLKKKEPETPLSELETDLETMGFERGLGNTAGKILESLQQLDSILTSPDHISLKEFLSHIPMVYNIVIVSVHGYFGQEGVLGKPDTGGQVVYILDQVKALEKEMKASLESAGVSAKPKIIILTRLIPNAEGTKCNEPKEKVKDTDNVWIVRVPFREHDKNITDNWISRFEIWPYLEEFADDSYKKLLEEFGTRPDLVIGNYSDGNLVATILSNKFGVTQCNVAHALEKSKYLYSALYWNEMEMQYHFSIQFTADLLAMNSADFIITSTYQEIAGTEDSIGQYESYKNFTMPELYRVAGGINIFHPKFNILPPGVDTNVFFPYSKKDKRNKEIGVEIDKSFFKKPEDDVVGHLKNPDLPPIFSMARLDKIKNLTSLVKWFGESKELQSLANLIIVAGKIKEEDSSDTEEKEQIRLMYEYIDEYDLKDHMRWIEGDADRKRVPEYFRVIADKRGVFIQPALFEGFGLTVLESMRSGLPTFATMYGGPLEIIEDEISGFHINPVDGKETTEKLVWFFKNCKENPEFWEKISKRGIKRVDENFNWKLYSKNLLSLAKIYGFWKYTSDLEMTEMNTYLDLMFHTLYKPRAKELLKDRN